MKSLFFILLLVAIPVILGTIVFFILSSLIPQKVFHINPSRDARVYNQQTSWEEELYKA